VRIEFLADHPEHAATLARWHYDEWQPKLIPEWTYQEALRELESHRARAAIPTTFVALEGDELIGSASLVVEDLPEWKQLTPWMASVFVAPAWRGRGVGRELVRFAESLAGQLGVPELYLLTAGQAEYYRRLGWSVLDVPPVPGRPVTIMKKRWESSSG
jgi:predicted N-acetyltransferase YhbS